MSIVAGQLAGQLFFNKVTTYTSIYMFMNVLGHAGTYWYVKVLHVNK
jgi:hypothetical protein